MKEYTIYMNYTLVGHIEANSEEEAIEYAKENWEVTAKENE